jgi:hypothetical protein
VRGAADHIVQARPPEVFPMTSPQPLLRTFLTLALLTVLVMITFGMSGSLKTALPALAVWATLAATYGTYRVIRTWSYVRPAT